MDVIDRLHRGRTHRETREFETWPVRRDSAMPAGLNDSRLPASSFVANAGGPIDTSLAALVAPLTAASRSELTAIIPALFADDPYLVVLVAYAR